MVVWENRTRATDVEDRRKKVYGESLDEWDMLMSPTPISPTSQKFEPSLTVGMNYSYNSFTKKKE